MEPKRETIACEKAQERYKNHAILKGMWDAILWILGVVIVVSLIAALLSAANSAWSDVLLSAVATVASSSGVTLVWSKRQIIRDEEAAAWKDLVDACGDQSANEFKTRIQNQ